MDKGILKLLPKKAFKLLSVRETLRVAKAVTTSVLDNEAYEFFFHARVAGWKFDDVGLKMRPMVGSGLSTKEDGERVLRIYFSQFFEVSLPVHIDLRPSSFFSSPDGFYWVPSKLHYSFSPQFLAGVRSIYTGFYSGDDSEFEKGLVQLGMITDSMGEKQKNAMKELFHEHFGEGKLAPVKFSLENLQHSFNAIFSYFLKEDIPLNPEFAVLGICLVTLYLTLQDIPHALDVNSAFSDVTNKYQNGG